MPRSPTSPSPRSSTPVAPHHGRSRSTDSKPNRPSTLFVPDSPKDLQDPRRPSVVQFASPARSGATSPTPARPNPRRASSYAPGTRNQDGRRMSSPPPPPVFTPRVGFDTFDNKEASDFSLSLQSKHKDYEYTKRSRTFLCGTDMNDYSEFALEWLIDELVDDGDEIVCLRVVEKDSKFAGDASIQEGKYREEANKMMEHIQSKNTENKAINLVLEFSVGKVQDTIQNMIKIYEPAILVVGTRGRSLSGFSGIMSGSVSKYCLQSSPVPVIVVRPTSKRNKKKRKRAQDPSRHGYRDILDKSGTDGTQLHMVGASVADDDNGGEAGEGEAKAVLDAIGYNPGPEFAQMDPFAKYQSERNDITNWSDVSSPRDLKSPGPMMKSPELQNLESPPLSDASSDEDEDEYDEEGGIEAVPGHTLLQVDEANRKAREAEKEIEAQAEEKQKDEESEDEGKGKGKAVEGKDSTHADLTENIKPRPKGDRADSEEP